jgi:hypothetical protein
MSDLTQQRLKEVLHYDPLSGEWTWLADMKTGRGAGRVHIKKGTRAGTVSSAKGYRKIGVDGRRYWAHRLAFLWMTGEWPKHHVDHIDGNGGNDVWTNMRDVPRGVNMQNVRRATVDSLTGILGVTFNRARKKWVAQISINSKSKGLGYFDTADAASAAYLSAKRQLHAGNTL